MLKRVCALFMGKIEKEVNSTIKKDPEIVYNQIIDSEQKKYTDIRNLLKEIKGQTFSLNQQLRDNVRSKESFEKDLKTAITTKNKEIGEICIRKIDECENNITSIEDNINLIKPEEISVEQALEDQKNYIEDIKTEYIVNSGKIKTNNVLSKIQDRRDNIISSGTDKNLEAVRKIANESAADNVFRIENKSDDEKINMFRKNKSSVEERFQEMIDG